MSSFAVTVQDIILQPHPNADRIEIGTIPGQTYQFVVGKGQFKGGDLFAYIPEGAVVPETVLQEMGLSGALDGPEHNRVKAHKFRGVLSQGLAYRPSVLPKTWVKGLDVAEELGIVKYEPPIPAALAGKVRKAPDRWRPNAPGECIWQPYTDIEHYKRYPHILYEGEMVHITEKLHGTCLAVMVDGEQEYVSSLGIARRGLMLEDEPGNLYWETARRYDLFTKLRAVLKDLSGWWAGGVGAPQEAMLFGEIVGIQDLKYGVDGAQYEFYAFDLKAGGLGFMFPPVFKAFTALQGIPTVPELYTGPFSPEVLAEHTNGKTTLMQGALAHIREGVVVKPSIERFHPEVGRVIFKSVSEAYLLRKNGSEFQ